MRSSQNRKLLSGLLFLVAAVALLAVYVLYFKSKDELPNEPPNAPAESSSSHNVSPAPATLVAALATTQ